MTESESSPKPTQPTREQIKTWWETIEKSGCPDIKDVIAGKSPDDFDPEAIEWLANFVLTSPPDTQAAPKINKK